MKVRVTTIALVVAGVLCVGCGSGPSTSVAAGPAHTGGSSPVTEGKVPSLPQAAEEAATTAPTGLRGALLDMPFLDSARILPGPTTVEGAVAASSVLVEGRIRTVEVVDATWDPGETVTPGTSRPTVVLLRVLVAGTETDLRTGRVTAAVRPWLTISSIGPAGETTARRQALESDVRGAGVGHRVALLMSAWDRWGALTLTGGLEEVGAAVEPLGPQRDPLTAYPSTAAAAEAVRALVPS